MTPPTIEALQASVAQLRIEAERAADESHWPGAGLLAEEFTNPIRRARFKAAKLSAQTLALLARQEAALEEALYGRPDPGPEYSDEELQGEIARFETEAALRVAELGLRGGESGGTMKQPDPSAYRFTTLGGVLVRPTT